MTEEQDAWMTRFAFIAEPRRAQAIVLLSISSSRIEDTLADLIHMYAGLDMQKGPLFTNDMGGEVLDRTLKRFLERHEHDGPTKSLIFYALECAGICRSNRNLLSHFLPDILRENIAYERRTSKASIVQVHDLPLEEIRQVAEQANHIATFFGRIATTLTRYRMINPASVVPASSWPDRPPRPYFLRDK